MISTGFGKRLWQRSGPPTRDWPPSWLCAFVHGNGVVPSATDAEANFTWIKGKPRRPGYGAAPRWRLIRLCGRICRAGLR
ncbi:MAG: hypothetical protein ACK52U_11950 [Synechococcaceae cyanobacterium]